MVLIKSDKVKIFPDWEQKFLIFPGLSFFKKNIIGKKIQVVVVWCDYCEVCNAWKHICENVLAFLHESVGSTSEEPLLNLSLLPSL